MSIAEKYLHSKRIFVFLLFVLFASIGWLMNKLSADYMRTVFYHIDFYNSKDERRIFKTETDIFLQINMNGFSAMRYSYSTPNLMRIDLSSVTSSKTRNYVLAADVFQEVSEQLGDGKKLAGISPDTIYFSYNDQKSKRLPVMPNLNVKFANEYMQKGNVFLSPDSIWVSAEQNILDTLTEISCISKTYENFNSSVSGTLEVDLSKLENVALSQTQVNFRIDVERYSESAITVPLELLHQPDSVDVMIFPREIEIKYRANMTDFAKIKPEDFKLVLDFNDLQKNISRTLKVDIAQKPAAILQVELYPEFVELLVNKK